MNRICLLAVALLLAGCAGPGGETEDVLLTPSTSQASAPAPTVNPTPPSSAIPKDTVTVTAAPSGDPLSGDALDEVVYLASLTGIGVDMGSATDYAQVALGYAACKLLDEGAAPNLAWAMLILDDHWPDDAQEDAPIAVALAASQSLCPEHEEAVFATARGE